MKAMIFAAGFGTRLRPFTNTMPKVLVEIKGRPLLDWIIDHLSMYGVTEFIINTHHFHSKIDSFLKGRSYSFPIELSYEPKILGTGGGLYKTRDGWGKDLFIAYNGDVLSNANLNDFVRHHLGQNVMVSLAVTKRKSESMLLADQNGELVGIERKGNQIRYRSTFASVKAYHFCGMHIISPEIFTVITSPAKFSIIDQYLHLLQKGMRISVWDIQDSYWESIEDEAILDKAHKDFPGLGE